MKEKLNEASTSARQKAFEEFEENIRPEAVENAKLQGANEYVESAEGKLMLEEKVEEGMRAYKEAVLEELSGTARSTNGSRIFSRTEGGRLPEVGGGESQSLFLFCNLMIVSIFL